MSVRVRGKQCCSIRLTRTRTRTLRSPRSYILVRPLISPRNQIFRVACKHLNVPLTATLNRIPLIDLLNRNGSHSIEDSNSFVGFVQEWSDQTFRHKSQIINHKSRQPSDLHHFPPFHHSNIPSFQHYASRWYATGSISVRGRASCWVVLPESASSVRAPILVPRRDAKYVVSPRARVPPWFECSPRE